MATADTGTAKVRTRLDAGAERLITFRLALATFAILALELALIRWMSHQVRIFAYLNNILLMASFLGMGLGVALGRRRQGLIHAALPSLAALSAILCYSRELNIMRLSFPDMSISIWGGEVLRRGDGFVTNLAKTMLLFAFVVWIFICLGSIVGVLFNQLRPLKSYSADLAGSLFGVLAIAAVSALGTSPPIWFLVATIPVLVLTPRILSFVAFGAVLIFTWLSIQGAGFSPYNRLDLRQMTGWPGKPVVVVANRDAHQNIYDLSHRALQDPSVSEEERQRLRELDYLYSIPFLLTKERASAVVVGAGTGNDVAAALRNGFGRVVSIDIDPSIIGLGKALHPERPYSDPRVQPVVNDARAYFEQQKDEEFDVVCFGLLDSHAMFSAMSSLRLDNYVYTVEAIRSAWKHVRPRGVLTISFSVYAGEWIPSRIYKVISEATGQQPHVLDFKSGPSRTFIVEKGPALHPPGELMPLELPHEYPVEDVRIASDDWPFLYIRPGVVPYGYLSVLMTVLLLTAAGARYAFGRGLYGRDFNPAMFAMGAGFLLIETRGVTTLSLLFGSTWIVNVSVFAGVLIIVLLANAWVERHPVPSIAPLFMLLFASLVLMYAVPVSSLLSLSMLGRGLVGGLLNALPIGFAGIIFSNLLQRSKDASNALGSNLLGAILGGCLEYVSMFTGLQFLTLIAVAIYFAAYLFARRQWSVAPQVFGSPG